MGAAGLAVTQPVLDVFGRNPEFFVVGRCRTREIVLFALTVALVPAVIAIAGATVAWLAHPTLGAVAYGGALAGFGVLFALLLLHTVGVDDQWLALGGAAALATLLVWLDRTRRTVRTLLSYLAFGNVAFVLLFLFASPAFELVAGRTAADAGGVSAPQLSGPVVLVVLAEFPIGTIMRPDDTINASRYPNLARLAEGSTWCRNASSLHPMTSISVPSILTGSQPEPGDLPTAHDHPESYLTLFGDRYPINSYESVTDMVPPGVAWVAPAPHGSVGAALRDGTIVYGHQVLPSELATACPASTTRGVGSQRGRSERDGVL